MCGDGGKTEVPVWSWPLAVSGRMETIHTLPNMLVIMVTFACYDCVSFLLNIISFEKF